MSEVLEILKKDSSNLTDEQTKEFEQGFLALKKQFETADIDDLNDDDYLFLRGNKSNRRVSQIRDKFNHLEYFKENRKNACSVQFG